ncbi:MAG TPA: C25 family cysteine peptidase, partial [Pirellulales bacterium]|nr:C25 family cysteine peptidase [Pirellulales bacterium]
MKRLILVATLIVGFSAGGQSSAAEPQKWIVAVAPDLRSAVEPLIKRRRQEGMTVTVINVAELPKDAAGAPDAAELQKRIEHEARHGTNRAFVLVVGVAASSGEDAKKVVVPARSGTGGRMKGQPTDHGYGLPDEKMLPSIAVGRMPARSIEEAKTMVEKTLAFERERSGDGWRNRLTVLEGNPGGGNDFERRTAEAVVPSQIQGRFAKLNPEWSARFVVHVDSSPYSVGDSELRAASLDCVRQGQFWTVYLGHSSAPGLWSLDASYLDRKDWSELNAGRHRGLLFTCGCFACQTAGFGGEGYALA